MKSFLAIVSLIGLADSKRKLRISELSLHNYIQPLINTNSASRRQPHRNYLLQGNSMGQYRSRLLFQPSTICRLLNDQPPNCVAKTPNRDMHHEGHTGYLAIDTASFMMNLVG